MPTVLEIAQNAANAGGRVLVQSATDHGAVRAKSAPTDFVSEADINAGVAITQAILAADPNARIVIEEPEVFDILDIEPGSVDDPEVWIVDPLDGTTSFLHGFPCYSVSIAFAREGVPVAGAVYNVALDEMCAAAADEGATRGGVAMTCSDAREVGDALVVTGFPYDRGAPLTRQLAVLAAFLRAPVHGVRRDGSAAVDLCHVASGRADGFWEFGLKPWDMAAGVLMCREAGAVVTDVDGEPWTLESNSVLAANPRLHPRMLEIIKHAHSSA